jgi:hypothetical protein
MRAAMMSRQDDRPASRAPSWGTLPAVTTQVEVHVGPFAKLRDVFAFVERLKTVTGVRDVRLDRWVAGHAVLVVRHHDRMPLLAALRELEDGSASVSVRQPHGVQIDLRPRP